MKKKNWLVMTLLGVNLALGAALLLRGGQDSAAYAQVRGGRPALMTLAGHVGGALVYYVLDTNSGKLVVLRSVDGKQVAPVATAVVSDDLDRALGRP